MLTNVNRTTSVLEKISRRCSQTKNKICAYQRNPCLPMLRLALWRAGAGNKNGK